MAAKDFTGFRWPSRTARHPNRPSEARFQILTVRSADPLRSKSETLTKHSIGFWCPLRAPLTTMWFALSSLSHTNMERSQAPENSTEASSFRAKAFTADLCFSNVATSTCRFSPAGLAHTRIFLSADPVYTVPSKDTAIAFTASSCAFTDSTHRKSESRHIFKVLSHETE